MSSREAQLQARLQQREEELERLRCENRLLRQKINLLSRRLFGKSSEKLSADQLQLLLELSTQEPQPEEQEQPEPPLEPQYSSKRRARPQQPRLPEHLPCIEEVIDPEPVLADPDAWRCIGQEVSEQLDYEPARFIRRRLIRRTWVHRREKERAPLRAPLPPVLQERCLAAPGLLAQVVVAKYCDHLPLYRQEQIFKRHHAVEIPRQTLARWIDLVAGWFQPVYGHLQKEIFSGEYVQIDETPVRYLVPGNGQTKQGYLWTVHRPGLGVLYRWETSRGAGCLENLVPVDFAGTLQCDGYAAYTAMARGRQGAITLAGCWAHARRNYYEAWETGCRTARWFLHQIGHLYRIEERLRQKRFSPKLRALIRLQESRPILDRLQSACQRLKQSGRHLPQSPMGRAIDYTLNQWPGLEVYQKEGQVEIDNNLVENAIRPTAVGKKNWLFFGHAQAGQRSAILYTIIENCRRLGIDPYDYLRDVLSRLPHMTNHQIPTVTPAAWAGQKTATAPPLKQAS